MGEGCELRWERGLRWIRGRSARGPASTAMQVLLGLPAAGTASSEPGLLRALHPVVLVGTANHRSHSQDGVARVSTVAGGVDDSRSSGPAIANRRALQVQRGQVKP